MPCGWFAVRVYKAWQQSCAVEAIMKREGCCVYYDRNNWSRQTVVLDDLTAFQNSAQFGPVRRLEIAEPKTWTERLFGIHFARRAIQVDVTDDHAHEIMSQLKRLPYLQTVMVYPSSDGHVDKARHAVTEGIERQLPGVEVDGVEYVFSLQQNTRNPTAAGFASDQPDTSTDWPAEWTGFGDVATKLAWASLLLRL